MRRPGRPRSEQSRTAVLRAARDLMQEVGLRAMTTEQIAARSGASKATIYKWWPNKYAVAVEAFLSEMFAESADPDTGSARTDFRIALRGLLHFYASPTGRVFAQLVGEAQLDPRGPGRAAGSPDAVPTPAGPGDLGSRRRPRRTACRRRPGNRDRSGLRAGALPPRRRHAPLDADGRRRHRGRRGVRPCTMCRM